MTTKTGKSTRPPRPQPIPPDEPTLECLFREYDPEAWAKVRIESPAARNPLIGHNTNSPSFQSAHFHNHKASDWRSRAFNSIDLAKCRSISGNSSSNTKHIHEAWTEWLRPYTPLAQYILTIRCRAQSDQHRLEQCAVLADNFLNKSLFGGHWAQNPRLNERRVASYGVVEGTIASNNLHLHMVVCSRTKLLDRDMEGLCSLMDRKNLVSNFWYEEASRFEMANFNAYIFKGLVKRGPEHPGLNISDRVYLSNSLGKIAASESN